jgi:hypothetical protein
MQQNVVPVISHYSETNYICSKQLKSHGCDTGPTKYKNTLQTQNIQTQRFLVHKQTILTMRPPWPAKYCRLMWVEGVAWSAQLIPTAFNLGFLDKCRYYFFQGAPH